MFRPFKKSPDPLDEAIDRVMLAMSFVEEDTEEYKNLLEHLQKLSEVKTKIRPKPISAETLVTAGASLVGVLILVGYEHAHVVTSKAVGFIPKPKNS